MIFSNGLDDKVRDGTKTQTRRLVKDGDRLIDWPMPCMFRRTKSGDTRLTWRVDQVYAIQSGRGKKGNGRFRITKIRKERIQEINCSDCIAEGLTTRETGYDAGVHLRDQFSRLWNSIHKKPGDRWDSNPEVWVLEIEPVGVIDG